jgi:hypothetical protein
MASVAVCRKPQELFPLGRLLITPGAQEALLSCDNKSPLDLLYRHQRGDFGDLCEEDWDANERALKEGSRIFSSYKIYENVFWVITEADRSATTIMLPEEY